MSKNNISDDSDDDSDDDQFLFQNRVFAKPEKFKKTSLAALKLMASGKSHLVSRDDGNTDKPAATTNAGRKRPRKQAQQPSTTKTKLQKAEEKLQHQRAQKQNDPEWIDKQARKSVEELRLDVVAEVTSLDDIGWYHYAKNKKAGYYPAITCKKKAEARMLLNNKRKPGRQHETKNIQYIGVGWRYALTHEKIALSKWIPYTSCSASENEERLCSFIKTIAKTSVFKNDALGLKIEELAIRKMWGNVQAQQEQRTLEEEKERIESNESSSASTRVVSVTQEDSDNNNNDSSQVGNRQQDEEDMESDSDDSVDCESRKPLNLRVGDEIEFYEVTGVFGCRNSLQKDTIVGIRTKGSKYPLLLSNTTMPLPGNHPVRRLPDGVWQPINDYVLLQDGIQSLADNGTGFNKTAKKMKQAQSDVQKASDNFWKNAKEKASKGQQKLRSRRTSKRLPGQRAPLTTKK